jgi:hypothetical protein
MSRADIDYYSRAYDHLLVPAAGQRAVADCSAGWVAELGPPLPARGERGAKGKDITARKT